MSALYLAICVALNGCSAICLKYYQKKNGMGFFAALLFTGIMTGTIALVALAFSRFSLEWNGLSFLVSVAMGVLYALNMPLYGKAMSYGEIGLCGVFLNLGSLLLPFIFGAAFLGEEVGVLGWLGLSSALAAVLLQIPAPKKKTDEKEGEKADGKRNLKFFLCGISIFLINGTFCVLLKVQSVLPVVASTPQILFFAGLAGAVASFGAIFCRWLVGKGSASAAIANGGSSSLAEEPFDEKKSVFSGIVKHSWLFALAYGALNGGMNMLNLTLTKMMNATVHFAVLSCGGLLLMAIFGVLIFKDKITKKTVLTMGLAISSILFFSF